MRYRLNKLSIRAKLITGALVLVIAGLSHASGTQVGGGATMPSILYVGSNAATMTQVSGSNIDPASLFGVYSAMSGNTVSYCQTGSGSGKNILAGIVNNNVQDICPTALVNGTTLHGFGAAAVGRTDLTQPNFVGADAPLNATDYNNYITSHGVGHFPVQFPVVAGAIAIAFNLVDNTGAQVTSAEVNFSDLQLGLIFSGQAPYWDDSRLAGAFNLTDGGTIPHNPINVQYRSDDSGTSFSFSNHLTVALSLNTTPTNPFETSQTFFPAPGTRVIPTYVVQNFFTFNPSLPNDGLPNGDGLTMPIWTGYSGDEAVAWAILRTVNSIGYVETADTLATFPNVQIADVNGMSPVTNFNVSGITTLSVANNVVISNTNNPNGTPVIQSITNPPGTKCIVTVKPSVYAVPSNKLLGLSIVPLGSYPIVAVSYFLGNSAGNGADLATTQGLVTSSYNSAITTQVTPVGGLKFIPVGISSGAIPFTSSQVSGCYGL